MLIDRELDKVFRVTITEKEAELICDCSVMNMIKTDRVALVIGRNLLAYMQNACVEPHAVKPSTTVEL